MVRPAPKFIEVVIVLMVVAIVATVGMPRPAQVATSSSPAVSLR